jgi:hypothetical protein
LTDALQQGIREGLPAARLENRISAIDGPLPLFIDGPDLTQRVLKELKHYAEERSGEPMVSFNFNWVILRVSFDFVSLDCDRDAPHLGRSQNCMVHHIISLVIFARPTFRREDRDITVRLLLSRVKILVGRIANSQDNKVRAPILSLHQYVRSSYKSYRRR